MIQNRKIGFAVLASAIISCVSVLSYLDRISFPIEFGTTYEPQLGGAARGSFEGVLPLSIAGLRQLSGVSSAVADELTQKNARSLVGSIYDPTKNGSASHPILNEQNGFREIGAGSLDGECDVGLHHYDSNRFQLLVIMETVDCTKQSVRFKILDAVTFPVGLDVFGYETGVPNCGPYAAGGGRIIAGRSFKRAPGIVFNPIRFSWKFDRVSKKILQTKPSVNICEIDLSDNLNDSI